MPEMLLTVEEFANRTHQHAQTVRRQIRRGAVPTVRTGRKYLIPESAAMPTPRGPATPALGLADWGAEVETIWGAMVSGDAKRHNAALRTLFAAPEAVRAIIARRSAEVADAHYATPDGEAELADWRALDGEAFHDDAGDYYSPEEEARFQASRDAQATAGRETAATAR